MTANNLKTYLGYLNKLVEEYNNNYHHSIGKKPVDTDYSTIFNEDIKMNPKAPNFKVDDRVTIIKYKNILTKGYTEKK